MLLVGIVRRPHGLEGEVSVEVHSDFPQRFAPGQKLLWRRDSQERVLTVASSRPHSGRLLLKFEGVTDARGARELAGGDLEVRTEDAVAPPEHFYYSHEIAGWLCEDASGRPLGRAEGLERTPGGALLALKTKRGKSALVPFVYPIVLSLDRAARKIVLDPPEGLLEL